MLLSQVAPLCSLIQTKDESVQLAESDSTA